VNGPRVVFFDEPTLGLDPAGQREVLALVRQLAHERGVTVLLTTHLLAEVEETCGRVLILNNGRIAAEGTVAEVARRAAAPRTARLTVPVDRLADALATLERLPGWASVERATDSSGELYATLAGDAVSVANDGVGALLAAGVDVLAFEVEGARLSDAFLAMTEAA